MELLYQLSYNGPWTYRSISKETQKSKPEILRHLRTNYCIFAYCLVTQPTVPSESFI